MGKNNSTEYADKRISISQDEYMWTEIVMAYDEGTKNSKTEFLFDMLPPFINIDGKIYNFELRKGKRIGIWYKFIDENEYITFLKFGSITSDISLNDACEKMVKTLFNYEYVQYMPFGYKEKYENYFNVKISHSRDFEK